MCWGSLALLAGDKEAAGLAVRRHTAGCGEEGISGSRPGVGRARSRLPARGRPGVRRGLAERRAAGTAAGSPGRGGRAAVSAGGERARVCAIAAGGGGRRRRRAARPSAAPRRAPRLGELMAAPRCGRPAERRAQPPAAAQGASKMWGEWGGSGRSSARDGGAQQPPLARLC